MDPQVDLFIIKLVVCCKLLSASAFPIFLYTDNKGETINK